MEVPIPCGGQCSACTIRHYLVNREKNALRSILLKNAAKKLQRHPQGCDLDRRRGQPPRPSEELQQGEMLARMKQRALTPIESGRIRHPLMACSWAEQQKPNLSRLRSNETLPP
jgi:hypothetical protein